VVVALANFPLSGRPVFGFVAWFKSAALGKQVGEATDFILQIDGNNVRAGLGSNDLGLPRGSLCFGLSGF
jgi:hypothetical protein